VELGRASAELAGIVDDLDRAEAEALLATLNAHFASDGLSFVAPRPDQFFVRASTPPRLSTVATSAALRRPLRPLLPQGPDAATWRRWQSEIEMLLHEHPVNVARERAGRSQVGSPLVLRRRDAASAPHEAGIATFATDGIASALAAFAGASSRSLPADFGAAKADAGSVKSIVVALDRELDCDVDRARLGGAGTRRARRRLARVGTDHRRRGRRCDRLGCASARPVATDRRPLQGARSRRSARRCEHAA
jgi:hypothetical protein